MIKKLRQKFILISMFSLTFVIAIIIGIINIHNYSSIVKRADEKLELIINNNGIFPREKDNKIMPPDNKMSPEAPFETRYFSVTFNNNGEVIKVNIDRIAAIDELSAESYATSLYNNSKTKGFFKNYRYQSKTRDTETLYVFIDCQHDLITFREFLYASLLFSLIGITTIFLLVFFSSKIILKPISESYEKQKHFITDASHELKTPLTSISGFAEILKNGGTDEQTTKDFANTIYEETQRMISLVNDIIKLSKLDEKSISQEKEEINLTELSKEVITPLLPVAEKKNVKIDLEAENQVFINGVRSVIFEMIYNLVENAIKYNKNDGKVIVKVSKISENPSSKKQNVVLSVSDTGIGIPKNEQERIFERFYRIDKSRSKESGGTGLGLSIVKHGAKYHNAKVTLSSQEGKGSTFTLAFETENTYSMEAAGYRRPYRRAAGRGARHL